MCKHSLCPYRACAWSWHSQQRNHCSLSKSWKGRKKRKGRRGGDVIPGWEQPPGPALVPVFGKEQQRGKGAEVPARSPLYPISASTHLKEAAAHLQLSRWTKLSPNPPLLPGQLQTTHFLELSPLDSLGEAPGVRFALTFQGPMEVEHGWSPAPGELLQPSKGFPTGAVCKHREEGRERILTTPALMKHPGPGERQ